MTNSNEGFPSNDREELGSLTQSARRTSLKSARTILIVIGLLTMGVNGALAASARSMVEADIQKELQANPGLVFDHAELNEHKETAIRTVQLIGALFALVGLVLILLRIFVYSAPVACTVLGLVLYVGGWLATVALNVMGGEGEDIAKALMSGIFIRVLIIVGLVKAVQTAIAYQREEQELRAASFDSF